MPEMNGKLHHSFYKSFATDAVFAFFGVRPIAFGACQNLSLGIFGKFGLSLAGENIGDFSGMKILHAKNKSVG